RHRDGHSRASIRATPCRALGSICDRGESPGRRRHPCRHEFSCSGDNHTLMFSFAGVITINPLIHDKLPYDPARDLVPVASVVDNFFAIAASATLKVASLEDFIRLVRSQPGKLNWAATPGLPDYIFAALQRNAGIKMTQVSYR